MNTLKDSSNDRIAEEAAEWFGRLREQDISNADRKQFANWLAESPVHVREYLGVSETWGVLQAAHCWPQETSEQLLESIRADAAGDNIVPFSDWHPSTREGSLLHARGEGAESPRRMRVFGFAAAASIAAVAFAFVWFKFWADRTIYSTGRGEQLTVVLPDTSVVQLNTMTRMVVHFKDDHRRIELPQGEAFFKVAHDSTRPFDVETPFAVVRAVGTEFNVNNRPTGTQVAVVEGKVQVAEVRPENKQQPIALGPKGYIEIGPRPAATAAAPIARVLPQTQAATAWMQRRIVFENTRLDAAVDEFNRYNKTQMQVTDADLAGLHISGVFSADDPEALMKYLKQVQDVDITRSDREITLQRNR